MPYIHLANGDVVKVTKEELVQSRVEAGAHNAYRQDGMEHYVIGVYPDEVQHPLSQKQLDEKAKQDAIEKAAFDKWKTDQPNHIEGSIYGNIERSE